MTALLPFLFILVWVLAIGFGIYIAVLLIQFLKLGIAFYARELNNHRRK